MGDVMTTPMKTCPYCKQEIPADATRCHHCREWVSKKTPFLRAVGSVLPVFLMFIGMIYYMERDMLSDQKYWEHSDAIKIVNHHAAKGAEGSICILGAIKNTSTIPWEMVKVRVNYLDAEDQLVDTSQDYNSDTLAPNQERTFKVTFEKLIPGAEYDHYRVFIAGAYDASRY